VVLEMSLFWRIFLLNAVVLISAAALLLLGPATVSTPFLPAEALIMAAGLVAMLVANGALLRIGLAPLGRLNRLMTTIDLLHPGTRLDVSGRGMVADLIRTFNQMLDRLEAERGESTGRALSAQEGERRRVAQELHDEVGQTLTAVLLQLKRVSDKAPDSLRTDLAQVQETTRGCLTEVSRIARRLRPGDLEVFGLVNALKSLADDFSAHNGLTVRRRFDTELSGFDHETELVIYRVAQEGLTNVVRHAHAREVEVLLHQSAAGVELRIRDDGRGIGDAPPGAGITGMRERALLIGADLVVEPGREGGTEVHMHVPHFAANVRSR
jgi:two-component system, NarL family, sensor histidine kinase UhpB